MINHNALLQRALILVWIGFIWNIIEATISLWSASTTGSVALLAYGLDSLIEIFAGAVLIWRLRLEKDNEQAETKALKLIGITFFLLALFVMLQSFGTLTGWLPKPQESLIGILLVLVSAVLMTVLFIEKSRIAKKIGSRALRAEAVESLICDLQDLTVLIGLGLYSLYGWWWADPIAALFLIPFLLKEGWEAIQ